ncbi:MAG: GntR family transcriptional regulator [Gammaproteobacteria bacterium]|nr:GntR family transcriptional regulator [Gammaproteobacteria bacterium]
MDKQSEYAYRQLKQMMVEGQFEMGIKLTESTLAKQLDLSRTPIRQALARLESEGFVEYEDRRGHRTRVFTDLDVQQIYAVRALVESEAAQLSCEKGFSVEQLEELGSLIERMGLTLAPDAGLPQTEVRARFMKLNHRFHWIIYSNCPNTYLISLMRQFVELPLVIRNFFHFSYDRLQRSQQDHQLILAAIKKNASDEVRKLFSSHILASQSQMIPNKKVAGMPGSPEFDETAGWADILDNKI